MRNILIAFFFLLPLFFSAAQEGSGSTALEAARRRDLGRTLREGGIPFEEHSLFADYGGFGSSIEVHIPSPPGTGEDVLDESFVLAIPLSGINDGGAAFPYGFELGLAFIQRVLEQGADADIRVAFLGDEFPHLAEDLQKGSHRGLEDLINHLENPENAALVYIDLFEAPRGLVIHHGARNTLAPLSILRPLPDLCDSHGIPYAFSIRFNELYKLNLARGPSALEFAQAREVPAFYVSGSPDGGARTLEAALLADMLLDYANSLRISTENMDYHYSLVQFRGKTLFLSEPLTIVLALSAAVLLLFIFLIYSVIYRYQLVIQWRVFIQRFWVLLLLFAVLALSLQGMKLFFHLVLGLFGISETQVSYGGIALQLLLGMFLFSALSPLSELLEIPRKANFYGNSAVILVTLGILTAALLDITFMPIFTLTFLFTLLGAVIRVPLLVGLCGLLTPIQAAVALINLMNAKSRGLVELILAGNGVLTLYIALVSLPFFLIFKRSAALAREQKKGRLWRYYILPRLILLGLTLGGLGLYVRDLSKTPAPQPVRRTLTQASSGAEILKMDLANRIFLERRILEITLSALGSPVRFDLYLDSAAQGVPPVIYAAPMPFSYTGGNGAAGEGSVEFTLGEGPPNPFTTEIVVPLDFRGSLRAEAVYTEWDPALDTLAPPAGDDYALRIIHRIPVGN
ncbi:MAG: hypothetical protein LBP93_08210 [Treponema sp.]|jgi:hypothetical protein|nr:hypothetical protein [Treponema sp.]